MFTHPRDSQKILFVFLGASNLARGHYALANCLKRSLYPRPVQFLFAHGPGRGYLAWGGFLRKVYSPIRSSGIFSAARANKCQVVALLTDIGNDIMYNVSPWDITACLEKIITQLQEFNAIILTTPIPSSLENKLNQFSFFCLRSILYPRSKVRYKEAVEGMRQINKFLKNSVSENLHLFSGLEEFSGSDRIHYSLWRGHLAWSRIAAQILQVLGSDSKSRIGFPEMLASYTINMKQLIIADFFSLQDKGPEYY